MSRLVAISNGLMRFLSVAGQLGAWAAIPLTMRSALSVKTPTPGWPKNNPPSTAPVRETTGTAR